MGRASQADSMDGRGTMQAERHFRLSERSRRMTASEILSRIQRLLAASHNASRCQTNASPRTNAHPPLQTAGIAGQRERPTNPLRASLTPSRAPAENFAQNDRLHLTADQAPLGQNIQAAGVSSGISRCAIGQRDCSGGQVYYGGGGGRNKSGRSSPRPPGSARRAAVRQQWALGS